MTIELIQPTPEQVIDKAKKETQFVLFGDGHMIRMYGACVDHSYWLFQLSGKKYIGYVVAEGRLPKLFPNKPQYEVANKDGKVIYVVQELF